MARGMHVVGALAGLREAGEASVGAQRLELLEAARDQLVRIGLMAHVEDEPVARAVQHAVHGQDDLHGTERRAHVTARLRRHGHDLLAYLAGEDGELFVGQQLEVGRRRDHVENAMVHSHAPRYA